MKVKPHLKNNSISGRKLSKLIAGFASDKKAEDIVILDMRKIVNYCDYFVICSGNTDRQVRAIANHIDEELDILGLKRFFRQGLKRSDWIIFDVGDVVAHIFQKRIRQFYELEYLWQEAKRVHYKTK